jgi:PKD repeat protein
MIVSYLWDFGDGTSSSLPAPVKTFTESGDHYVTLTVTDDDGLTGQATRVITVVTLDPPQCMGTRAVCSGSTSPAWRAPRSPIWNTAQTIPTNIREEQLP